VLRGRRLNTRGKIALSVFLTITIVLLFELIGNDEKQVNGSNIKHTLQMLTFSTEPVVAFADSTLSQSIIEKESKEREVVRKKEVAKQNQIDQQENAIYLTFDDGPSYVTDQLLDILNQFEMKATFFMLGPNMQEHPKVVKRMHKEEFGLALHGITHNVAKIYSNPFAPSEEMTENQEIMKNLTGAHTDIIRLPYGSIPYLTEDMRYLLDQKAFHVWDWNVDSRDWELKNERYVQHTIREIQKMEQAGETPIILLHDKPDTIKHLPKLLTYIKSQGYKTKVLTNDMSPLTFPCEGRCRPISNVAAGGNVS
jgi:peptidoglycan/xylan/chitin deacetylase (PgdA/CDA1 family)